MVDIYVSLSSKQTERSRFVWTTEKRKKKSVLDGTQGGAGLIAVYCPRGFGPIVDRPCISNCQERCADPPSLTPLDNFCPAGRYNSPPSVFKLFLINPAGKMINSRAKTSRFSKDRRGLISEWMKGRQSELWLA